MLFDAFTATAARCDKGMECYIGLGSIHSGWQSNMQADQRKTIQRLAEIGYSLVEPLLALLERQGDYPKVVLSRETLLSFLEDCANGGITAQTAHVFADTAVPLERMFA